MKKLFLHVLLLMMSVAALAYDEVGIHISQSDGEVLLAGSGTTAAFVVSAAEREVVREVASQAYASDMELLTGQRPVVVGNVPEGTDPIVIAGTIGTSPLIAQLVADGAINTTAVANQWETFGLQTTTWQGHPALVIFGSDPRGTAYGVFELSRAMGVTPYVWWGDVTPEHKEQVYVSCNDVVVGPPSVKYRGLFINDEDWGLQPWAARHMDTDVKDLGPRTYAKFFELMLRLKANYCWPGMHPCTKAFWYYKENPEVARRYDIVMGSSHCEPLLRNNVDEWQNNFVEEYGYASGAWNWKTNSATITTYWTDRVKEAKNTDAIYTIGMRGIHDSSMPGYTTNAEKHAALKEVIGVQRQILEEQLGVSASEVPQIFCPYKEALTLYRMGLDLPEDVTLCWADDNFGYVRQLSNAQEQTRQGGGGVYYHFSYWGVPYDHLWLGSVSPTLTSYELTKAYDLNCKNVWIFNVGDVKPHEIETQFAMDFAWDVDRWSPDKAQSYLQTWATEYFGTELATEVARVKNEYYRLAASGKPEHVQAINFTREEMVQRLKDYMQLENDVQALRAQVPARLQDAFYEMVYYPCMGAANINKKVLFAKMSFLAAEDGDAALTSEYGNLALQAYDKIVGLTDEYNNTVADGKWEGMMNYAPRSLSQFYAPKVATQADVIQHPEKAPSEYEVVKIGAADYTSKGNSSHIQVINGLGITDKGLTVLPLNMTAYTATDITSAPYVEYDVKVMPGQNTITTRCLPTFPLYTDYNLRFAVSIAGATPVFHDITMQAEASPWSTNVVTGYSYAADTYTATKEETVKVRVYLADPGVVLSELQVRRPTAFKYVEGLVNAGFEYKSEGVLNNGVTTRGDAYGWTREGDINGTSYGLSKDATGYEGTSICWYNSTPMPAFFQLSQTLKGLAPGKYRVRCKLGVFTDQVTNQRLFANQNVQYYGPESDYVNNLTEGETNTFAGHAYGVKNGSKGQLNEMYVDVTLAEGEDLTVGIRSSNKLSDGSAATTNAGWFKVDDFRIQDLSQEVESESEDYQEANKELLRQALREAASVPTANVGDGAFQYSQESVNAYAAALSEAQRVCEDSESTYTELTEAVTALNAAYTAIVVNGPAESTSYTLTLSQSGFTYDGYAITYIAGGNSTTGGYQIRYNKPSASSAQAFRFTPVDGCPNCFYLSQKDNDGVERYLCTSYTGYGSSGNLRSIRTTTDSSKALALKVIPSTNVEGICKLLNTEYTTSAGYLGSYDSGVYTEIPGESGRRPNCTDFIITPVFNSFSRQVNANRFSTVCLPFAATTDEGTEVYSITGYSDGTLFLETVDEMEAGVPYFFKRSADGTSTFTNSSGNIVSSPVSQNGEAFLTGTFTEISSIPYDGVNTYALKNNVFYPVSSSVKCQAYRAYLTLESPSLAREVALDWGGETGITHIVDGNQSVADNPLLYNLSGQRVNRTTRGVCIENGKKIIR